MSKIKRVRYDDRDEIVLGDETLLTLTEGRQWPPDADSADEMLTAAEDILHATDISSDQQMAFVQVFDILRAVMGGPVETVDERNHQE